VKESGQVLIGRNEPGEQVKTFPLPDSVPGSPPSRQHKELVGKGTNDEPESLSVVPTGLSCAEIAMLDEQGLTINQTIASVAADYLVRLLLTQNLDKFQTYIDLNSGSMKSTTSHRPMSGDGSDENGKGICERGTGLSRPGKHPVSCCSPSSERMPARAGSGATGRGRKTRCRSAVHSSASWAAGKSAGCITLLAFMQLASNRPGMRRKERACRLHDILGLDRRALRRSLCLDTRRACAGCHCADDTGRFLERNPDQPGLPNPSQNHYASMLLCSKNKTAGR